MATKRKKPAGSSVRDAIRREVKRQKITLYQLHQASGVSLATVYGFLRDGGDRATVSLSNAEAMMTALGLSVGERAKGKL